MAKSPENLTEAEAAERASAHPMAVPFLWLGKESVIKNFIWLPLAGMANHNCIRFDLSATPHCAVGFLWLLGPNRVLCL